MAPKIKEYVFAAILTDGEAGAAWDRTELLMPKADYDKLTVTEKAKLMGCHE